MGIINSAYLKQFLYKVKFKLNAFILRPFFTKKNIIDLKSIRLDKEK